MLKISGGQLRGITLKTPMDQRVRPTTGRVREALFSILGNRIMGAWVLDLFAGSGLLGLEAISRGANGGVFVERDLAIVDLIRHNLTKCKMAGRGEVLSCCVLNPALGRLVRQAACQRFGTFSPIDLVLLDPPYGQGLVPTALKALAQTDLLAPQAVAVAEHEPGGEGKESLDAWQLLQNRSYGDTRISFWQWHC